MKDEKHAMKNAKRSDLIVFRFALPVFHSLSGKPRRGPHLEYL